MARLTFSTSYATWQARPKLTFSAEGILIRARMGQHRSRRIVGPLPVERRRRLRTISNQPRAALAARTDISPTRGGLFSNQTQALKEATGTYKYALSGTSTLFLEYRRRLEQSPVFITSNPAAPSSHQDTALLGLVWWYGGKAGSW